MSYLGKCDVLLHNYCKYSRSKLLQEVSAWTVMDVSAADLGVCFRPA